MILMDIEHELRVMYQARLTTDGIHFDSIEGQAWLNRVFQERLDELEVELFDTGVLREEGASSETVITTFVPLTWKHAWGRSRPSHIIDSRVPANQVKGRMFKIDWEMHR